MQKITGTEPNLTRRGELFSYIYVIKYKKFSINKRIPLYSILYLCMIETNKTRKIVIVV